MGPLPNIQELCTEIFELQSMFGFNQLKMFFSYACRFTLEDTGNFYEACGQHLQ